MPLRRTNATRRQGTRPGGAPRRRRPNVRAYINRSKGATAQQKQLRTVANMVLRNRSIIRAQRQYQDFLLVRNESGGFVNNASQQVYPLMTPSIWRHTMRQSVDGTTNDRITYLRSLAFNYYLSTAGVVDQVQTTMFIVSPRSQFANWTGTAASLLQDTDWCSQGSRNAVYLNPSRFKVLWTRHFITFPENEQTTGTIQIPSGNPFTQYRRGRVSLKAGFSLRAQAGNSWKDLTIADLPPNQRMYLICFFSSINAGATTWNLNFGIKAVTVNSQ